MDEANARLDARNRPPLPYPFEWMHSDRYSVLTWRCGAVVWVYPDGSTLLAGWGVRRKVKAPNYRLGLRYAERWALARPGFPGLPVGHMKPREWPDPRRAWEQMPAPNLGQRTVCSRIERMPLEDVDETAFLNLPTRGPLPAHLLRPTEKA